MGFLDNLPFRKKKDDLALEAPNLSLGNAPQGDFFGAPGQAPQGYPPQQYGGYGAPVDSFQGQQTYQQNVASTNRDIELISAKLDALKATIESVNQRLAAIERYMDQGRRKTW